MRKHAAGLDDEGVPRSTELFYRLDMDPPGILDHTLYWYEDLLVRDVELVLYCDVCGSFSGIPWRSLKVFSTSGPSEEDCRRIEELFRTDYPLTCVDYVSVREIEDVMVG